MTKTLMAHDMLPGDVLVKLGGLDFKDDSLKLSDKMATGGIIALQTLRKYTNPLSLFRSDQASHSHIAMYAGDGKVLEEGSKGMENRLASAVKYIVYRYQDQTIAEKAVKLMLRWHKSGDSYYHTYGIGNFPGILLGASNYGPGARLEPFLSKNVLRTKGMVCSEAVIKSYQLAAKRLKRKPQSVVALHASKTSPMRFSGYMKKSDLWKRVGLVERNTLMHASVYGDMPSLSFV